MATSGIYNIPTMNKNIGVNDAQCIEIPCKDRSQCPDETNNYEASALEVPLHTPWTFWIDKSCRGFSAAEYEANMKKVYTVSTAQAFWSVFNNIPDVTEVSDKHSYHLMRYEHKPLWEDEYNSLGGTWRLKITPEDTPRVWKELLLAAIGEQFLENIHKDDDICGISVNVRERDNIVQIWNKNALLADDANVLQKVHALIPDLQPLAEFYKPHQTHHAFEKSPAFSK